MGAAPWQLNSSSASSCPTHAIHTQQPCGKHWARTVPSPPRGIRASSALGSIYSGAVSWLLSLSGPHPHSAGHMNNSREANLPKATQLPSKSGI